MNRVDASTGAPQGVSLPWLALSAIVGAAGMWLVLGHRTPPPAASGAPTATAVAGAAAAPISPDASAGSSPWPAPPPGAPARGGDRGASRLASASAPAVPTAKVPPGADPADYALDDATLARRARTQFGLDCPGIAERAPRRSGHLDVVCSNGLVLRIYLMGDGPPRIAPGH